MKKFNIALGFLTLAVLSFLAFGNSKAAAAFFTQYCDVLANPSSPNGSTVDANCQNGQNETALFGLDGKNSDTLKSSLISYLDNKSTSGYGFQKIGVAYIVSDFGGSKWKTNLSNPALILSERSPTNAETGCINTYYNTVNNSVEQYHNCSNQTSLIFTIAGKVVYIIKEDCGNPLGNYRLPTYNNNPGWNLAGQTTKTPNVASVYPGAAVTFNSYIRNASGSPATFSWAVKYCYDACTTTLDPGGRSGSESNVVASSSWGTPEDSWPISIPDNTTHNKICVWITWTNDTGSGTAGSSGAKACLAISQPNPSCVINGVPSSVTAGRSFDITPTVTYQSSTAASAVWGAGGRAFYTIALPPNSGLGGTLSGNGISGTFTVPPLPSGVYTITGGVKNSAIPSGNDSCTKTVTVGYNPYFSVLGGDIAAGPGFCGVTGPNAAADIAGKNTDNTPAGSNYYGAGAQLGALALSNITSFATAQASGTTSSLGGVLNPSALAFANNSPVTPPTYGGLFYTTAAKATASGMCVPDYVGTIDPAAPPPNFGVSGTYTLSGGSTLSSSDIIIPAGKFITIKVNGNLYINHNVGYAGYSKTDGIPRLTVLVRGNISIAPRIAPGVGVDNLSGFYVAEDDGKNTKGNIFTCGSPAFTAIQDYIMCNSNLTFNGGVAATKIIPGRTSGNLLPIPGISATPAEIFQFSPELWLAGLKDPAGSGGGLSTGSWQAITSLPPIL